MTAEELARLKELESKATKGPWFDAENKIGAGDHGIAEVDFDKDADRKMLIELRNAAPALIARAEWAEKARKVLRESAPCRCGTGTTPCGVRDLCSTCVFCRLCAAYPEGE